MTKKGNSGDYDVGYRKPPKHSRFKKGVSANPAGRRPGSKNKETPELYFRRCFRKKVAGLLR